MRSSSGEHFIALDHVRALAAFMVVAWHFCHGRTGFPVPFNSVRIMFPFSILDEGHTGVALFMTLSGYLFAKLLDGKSIHFPTFLWNRTLRLLPLLLLVILIVGIRTWATHENVYAYAISVAKGFLLPTLPNGGWSITAEFHFYLILPLLLWMLRKSALLPFLIIIAAIAFRFILHYMNGEVQRIAYHTIVGRLDQFTLGILAYQFRTYLTGRHLLFIAIITGFALFYWYFDMQGGYYNYPSYPSPSRLWIIFTTVEGIAFGTAIAWYETSFIHSTTGVSRYIGRMGELSYSIYILHFFIVFQAASFVNLRIMDISNFYVACFWSAVFFCLMMPIAQLSFQFVESPFLKLRKRYIAKL
jgi:peptidoglycan/LPS O-acetylase OafA/YrhL